MRAPFFQSLPARLAGYILVLSGLILLVLTELNRRAVERLLIDQAEVQAMLATGAVADSIDAVVGSAERLSRYLARDLEGISFSPAEVERLARNALQDYPGIYGLSVAYEPKGLDAATERYGILVHRSNVVARYVTQDLAQGEHPYWTRDWYREVLDKGQAVWSDPFFDQGSTERNVVRISMPFFRLEGDKRVPLGAVSVLIDLEWLRRLANSNEFSDTAFTIIFSRSGRIIIHPRMKYTIVETMETLAEKTDIPELASIRQNVLAKRQGSITYKELMPSRRVHANYRPAKIAGWGVVVGFEEQEFLKNQRAFRGIAVAFLGATLLLLGAIVITVTRYALRPLGQLTQAADEIAQRNLDCKIPVSIRQDEVGILTRSFEAMRSALKEQHLERRWANQALEHQLKYNNLIIDSMGELVFVLTKAMSISRINAAVTRVAGFAASDLIRSPLQRVVTLSNADGLAIADSSGVYQRVLKSGDSLFEQPAIILAKNGGKISVRLTLVPLWDANNVVGAVATLRVERRETDSELL